MKLNRIFHLTIPALSIAWMVTVVLLCYNNGRHLYVLSRVAQEQKDRAELENPGDSTNNANKSIGCSHLSGSDSFHRLKEAWPSLALPGDAGYNGAGININRSQLTERERAIYDLGLKTYKVNQLASDLLPLRRNVVLDMPECKSLSYDTSTLPTAGIVLIFHDEIWSVLLRTVFSLLDAGPSHLITEIVLVDDASKKDQLGKSLDEYIKIFAGKVKVVRLPKRKGLIAARLAGYDHVTGDVVIFLDAHCEVHKGTRTFEQLV